MKRFDQPSTSRAPTSQRSHVRKHATKHFKPKNKSAKKLAPTISRSRKQFHSLPKENDTKFPLQDSDCETCTESSSATANEHLEPTESDQDPSFYCKACKILLDKTRLDVGTMVLKRPKLRQQSELSPLEILGSGRSDPFSTYPVKSPDGSLHELVDFDKVLIVLETREQ